jgi:prevent-host-death family protein
MAKSRKWQLQEAKNKFSQVAEEAALYGPQRVTKRGKDALVILSVADYERLQRRKTDLVRFLKESPLRGSGIDAHRDRYGGREVKL